MPANRCASRTLVLVLVACAAAAAPASPASARTRIFHAIADATVAADRPNVNHGDARHLHVRRGLRAYLKFDVELPANERIVHSRLRLRPAPVRTLTVRRAGNDWTENAITWRTRPKAGKPVTQFTRTGTVSYVLISESRRNVRIVSRENRLGPALVLTTVKTNPAPGGTANPAGPPASAPPPDAPAAPGPVVDPIGPGMPRGDLPGWKQVFSDDFTRTVPLGQFPKAVSWKWWAYPSDWTDTSGRGVYDASRTLSVHNGVLTSFIHTSKAGVHYVSAPVPRLPGTSGGVTSTPSGQLYGRYSVRFRSDSIPGYKTAWLLWPDSKQWPRDGEIDFPEGNLDGSIYWFVHHQNGSGPFDHTGLDTGFTYGDWHIATIEWVKGRVTCYLDGRKVGETMDRVPSTPMHWVLQTETNISGAPVPDTSRGNVQVDWVSVWRPAG
jgi:hypothetical protein